jgi:hypothetical protein
MGYGCVCIFLVFAISWVGGSRRGGKKGGRVGFYRCSRRPSLFIPLLPRESSFYISILLHGSVQEVSGFVFVFCRVGLLSPGHVYTSAVTSSARIYFIR